MRHLKKGRKFGRERDRRRALMKSLASSFFMQGRIETTEAKAKELRPFVEKYITAAKSPTQAAVRNFHGSFSRAPVKKLLEHGSAMADRKGGYTRILRTRERRGDNAKKALI